MSQGALADCGSADRAKENGVSAPTLSETGRDGRADFDFYVGTWKVRNRRLKTKLQDANDWEEFDAVSVARPILGGLGNMDEVTMERNGGTVTGLTVRLYEPETQLWRLYWTSSLNTGPMGVPMVGAFNDGRGDFYCQEVFEGRNIFTRYVWSNITANTCRWEQAFSTDGGATWETNWIMESIRVE
jgi:hypothetical protein